MKGDAVVSCGYNHQTLPLNKKTMKRKILASILTATMLFSSAAILSACGNKETGSEQTESSQNISTDNEQNGNGQNSNGQNSNASTKENNIEETATDFVTAVCNKDYDKIISMFKLEENKNFLVKEDIEFCLPRSEYSDLSELNGKNITVTSKAIDKTKTEATVESQVTVDGENAPVSVTTKLYLNDNNEWCVKGDEFYNKDFSIRVPSKVTVTVNGKELTKEQISKEKTGELGLSVDCLLGYVGKKDIKVGLSCDNYTYEKSVPTKTGNELEDEERISYICDGAEKEQLAKVMKKYWNEMYAMYTAGKSSTDALKYIAKDADPDIVKNIWEGFKSIEKTSSNNKKGNENFVVTTVIPRDDYNTFYLTDSVVGFNFKYEITWFYKLAKWNQSQKNFSSILFKKEENVYKIYQITDEKLFNSANSFTHKW